MEARSRAQRSVDAESRLNADTALWLATGSQHGGTPYLVPVPFVWHESAVYLCLGASTLTARNLETTGYVRVALGSPVDVVLLDGAAEVVRSVPDAAVSAFGPQEESPLWFAIRPQRIMAWRPACAEEEADRVVFRDGAWL